MSQVNSLRELRPDDPPPSCHVCGSLMVSTRFKCLACGATTEAALPEVFPILGGKFGVRFDGHSIALVNLVSGEVIPDDEPLFLLRGRDLHGYDTLMHYLALCRDEGCNELHLAGIKQA